jgi:hypothetical protein
MKPWQVPGDVLRGLGRILERVHGRDVKVDQEGDTISLLQFASPSKASLIVTCVISGCQHKKVAPVAPRRPNEIFLVCQLCARFGSRRLRGRCATRRSSPRGTERRHAQGSTIRRPSRFGRRRAYSSRERVEGGCRAVPAQLVHVVKEHDVAAKRSEGAKE